MRYHESGQSHFITFSCYQRKPKFADTRFYDLFPLCLESMRLRFLMRIYGYVVMPEHVHLLVSEPEQGSPAEAMHYLKLSFSKRARSLTEAPVSAAQVSVLNPDANLRHQQVLAPMNRSGRRDITTGMCAACASLGSSCAICIGIRRSAG